LAEVVLIAYPPDDVPILGQTILAIKNVPKLAEVVLIPDSPDDVPILEHF
jgi:hypothetical protein